MATALEKQGTSGWWRGHGVNEVAETTNLLANPTFEGGSSSRGFNTGWGYTGGVSTLQKSSGASSYAMTAPAVIIYS